MSIEFAGQIEGHDTEYLHRLYEDGAGGLWMVPAGRDGLAIQMLPDGDWLADARTYGDIWDVRDAEPANEMTRERLPEGATLVSWVDVRGEVDAPDGREIRVYNADCGSAARQYIGTAAE